MTFAFLNAVAAIASIAGFVGWLWQVTRGRGTPSLRWGTFVISVVLLLAAGAGLSGVFAPPVVVVTTNAETVSPPPVPQDTVSTTHAPVTETHAENRRDIEVDRNAYVDRNAADRANGVGIVIVDESGARQPHLISAAAQAVRESGREPVTVFRDAAIAAHVPEQIASGSIDALRKLHLDDVCRTIVVGTVSRSVATETDAAIAGVITTRLHLNVQVIDTRSGASLKSFETDVRGGGFTAETSQTQAMERAAAAVQQELKRSFE
jgi:hypothetical protein